MTSVKSSTAPLVYITESATKACNSCERSDGIKARCAECLRWWHPKCGAKTTPTTKEVKAGKWRCESCLVKIHDEHSTPSDNVHEVSRSEIHGGGAAESTLNEGGATPFPDLSTILPPFDSKNKGNATPFEMPTIVKPSSSSTGPSPFMVPGAPASQKNDDTPDAPTINPPSVTHSKKAASKKTTSQKTNNQGSAPSSSHSSATQREILLLLDRQLEVEQRRIQIDTERRLLEGQVQLQMRDSMAAAELEHIKRRQEVLMTGSTKSSRANSSHHSEADSLDEVSEKVESWLMEVNNCKAKEPREPLSKSAVSRKAATVKKSTTKAATREDKSFHANNAHGLTFISNNVTVDDFLDDILGESNEEEAIITKGQMRARQVLNRELPEFSGDPTDWPSFMARFAQSTKRCGFTEIENLDRLSRCLKGNAFRAVKSELHKRDALPSVLATLRMLYGRPELIYAALMRQIRDGPKIKEDTLEGLVTFSMTVKSLCDTLRTADLQEYLHNPLLVGELLAKLPVHCRMSWGNFGAEMEGRGEHVNLETFNTWLKRQAEIFSATNLSTAKVVEERVKPELKVKKPIKFQGAHASSDPEESREVTWSGYCHICKRKGHITVECPVLRRQNVEERWESVRKFQLCMKCLGQHLLKYCGSGSVCGVHGCNRPHHAILHKVRSDDRGSANTTQSRRAGSPSTSNSTDSPKPQREQSHKSVAVHARDAHYNFQILPVVVSDGDANEISTYAFLDNGSEVTLMKQSLADKLRLKGPVDRLRLKWSNEETRDERGSQVVQLLISDPGRREHFQLRNVRTVCTLSLPAQTMRVSKLRSYPHLRSIPFEEYSEAVPEILIGTDNYQLLFPQETREGTWNEPAAVKTRLGWTVYGNVRESDALIENVTNTHVISNDNLNKLVEGYFALESIGIVAPKKLVESEVDAKAREMMKRVVQRKENGRYETQLLWKSLDVELPNSYPMACSRLKHFERKIEREGRRDQVNLLIKEYHDAGFLSEMSKDECDLRSPRTWYLPIFTVENPNKPGKVRLVWDAAAVVNGVSLNDHLYTGPDLTANLSATLFKFRERRVAVGGDIEKMFHQIDVTKQDQDAQRCLWRYSLDEPVRTSRMTVMTFGAACSPSLAQFVKNENAARFQNRFPRAVEAITHRHYVDDYLDSFDTAEEATRVLKEVVDIHEDGGFKLRGLISNDDAVIRDFRGEDAKGVAKLISGGDDENVKVLGMWWEVDNDVLSYRINRARIGEDIMSGEVVPTKRQVLRTLMMVFDPLGLIGFVNLKGKLVLKAIWRRQTDWDEKVHNEEFKKWTVWLTDLCRITEIKLPRCYFSGFNVESCELHVFVDAGEDAAAAVAYMVAVCGHEREVALVSSKTKIGPNKPTSIPRMELQAAVIGTRLASTIREQHSLSIRRSVYWTDSRNVLCWIRSPRRFKVFVAHRIGEIRESTRVEEWRYVPTAENPADLGTKWLTHKQAIPEMWQRGPQFLYQCESEWPAEPNNLPHISEEVLEARCNVNERVSNNNLCPDVSRFSSYHRLVRTQAYVLRFFYWGKRIQSGGHPISKTQLEPDEIDAAEKYIFREVQREHYSAEILCLTKGVSVDRSSKVRQYSPFLDPEGVLRSKSRLQEAEYMTYEQRCPIILPKRHAVTTLLIRKVHTQYLHQNHSTVLNELKQRYVIPSLRASLKSLRRSCWLCKRRSLRPEVPEMSPLPRSRLAARMRPFSYTGVDYFGPVMVKHGRRVEKKWGSIFTCLTTRAVHLELASSLSSDAFLLVLRCFIARRGTPIEVYCDNGTNFRGAESELKRVATENCRLASAEDFQTINWRFNPPHAPHMGGAWERLIRSVKSAMKCLISERVPSDDLMRTVLAECEMLVNSRPLTYVCTENNALEALTPNHFLLGSSNGTKPIGNFTDDPAILRNEWKRQQVIVLSFWRRFVAEYLPEISQRTKWYDRVEPLSVGDVVAVADSTSPGSWQLGRVQQAVMSKDGGVRQAVIKTATGQLRRPASKLAVLISDKLRSDDISSAGGGVTNEGDDTDDRGLEAVLNENDDRRADVNGRRERASARDISNIGA